MKILNLLKFKKESFTPANILRLGVVFWDRYSKLLFLLFSLSILSWGVYFWFQMTYRSDWNAEQKKQYQNSQSEEVELKEQQLGRVVDELERKKETFNASVRVSKDIFATYLVEEQAKKDDSGEQNSLPSSDNPINNKPSI